MKTWILRADTLCAQIFLKTSPEAEACLCRTIPCQKKLQKSSRKKDLQKFAHYVAEEIELACGAGTESQLVLCAEGELLKELRRQFSDEVKQVIVGVNTLKRVPRYA